MLENILQIFFLVIIGGCIFVAFGFFAIMLCSVWQDHKDTRTANKRRQEYIDSLFRK